MRGRESVSQSSDSFSLSLVREIVEVITKTGMTCLTDCRLFASTSKANKREVSEGERQQRNETTGLQVSSIRLLLLSLLLIDDQSARSAVWQHDCRLSIAHTLACPASTRDRTSRIAKGTRGSS